MSRTNTMVGVGSRSARSGIVTTLTMGGSKHSLLTSARAHLQSTRLTESTTTLGINPSKPTDKLVKSDGPQLKSNAKINARDPKPSHLRLRDKR